MFQELKFQLSTAILTVLTLAAGTAAFWNLDLQYHFRLPDDGVIWVDRSGGVEALHVTRRGPGANAGVHPGDRLESIQGIPIAQATDVEGASALSHSRVTAAVAYCTSSASSPSHSSAAGLKSATGSGMDGNRPTSSLYLGRGG